MDTWDWVLLLWWPLAVALGLSLVYFNRRGRRAGSREAFQASLRSNPGRYGHLSSPQSALPRPLLLVYALLWVAFTIGFIALLWSAYANARTMENLYAFNMLFGALFIAVGLSSAILPNVSTVWIKANAFILRPVVVLAGIGMIGYAGYILFQDMTKPHAIMEGRVGKLATSFSGRSGYRSWAFVGGQPFQITEEAQSGLKVGQRVRAELTAGSNVIVQTTVLAQPPPPRAPPKPR